MQLPRTYICHVPENYYWASSTNVGVVTALSQNCEFVLTINDDSVVDGDYLSSLVSTAASTGARLLGSIALFAHDRQLIWGAGAYNDWQNGIMLKTNMAGLGIHSFAATNDPSPFPAEYLYGNGTLIHRSVFETVGLFNAKETPHYHSDADFSLRASLRGIQAYVSTSSRIINYFVEQQHGALSQRNRRLFHVGSAFYLRAAAHIIKNYCPLRYRVKTLFHYYEKHLAFLSERALHVLLRVAVWLNDGSTPTGCTQSKTSLFDLSSTMFRDLSDQDFLLCAYVIRRRRIFSAEECEIGLSMLSSSRAPRQECLRHL